MPNEKAIQILETQLAFLTNKLEYCKAFEPKADPDSYKQQITAYQQAIATLRQLDNAVDEGYLQDWYIPFCLI